MAAKDSSNTRAATASAGATGAMNWTFPVGAAAILVAIVASFLLVQLHVGGVSLPGCGPGSGCDQATKSALGRIPFIGWPTAHFGLAWFAALGALWIAARGVLPVVAQWALRASFVGSIGLVTAMIVGGYVCKYCLAVHGANALLLVVSELRRRNPASPERRAGRAAWVTALGVFVLSTGILFAVQARAERNFQQTQEGELADSVNQIINGGSTPTNGVGTGVPVVPALPAAALTLADAEKRLESPLIGRISRGPDPAPIRIVVFTDFQCPDCKIIEGQIEQILATRTDVYFSPRHFPMCKDCNAFAKERNFNPHPNACWAARAAETARILYGEMGYWKMHHWLFGRGGSFTNVELEQGLAELGFDAKAFTQKMMSEEPLRFVQEDITAAMSLGLYYTPMIFINGVELRGWRAPGALPRAVEALAAENLAAGDPRLDRPPLALGKYVEDWRQEPKRAMPADAAHWPTGAAESAKAEVVLYGDFEEPNTLEVLRRLRAKTAAVSDVRLAFRHYPFDKKCNANMRAESPDHPNACRMAMALEAAGRLGGAEAWWKVADWLTANGLQYTDDALRQALSAMGLDAARVFAEMDSPEVSSAVQEDIAAAKQVGVRGVPHIIVDGRQVPRWKLAGQPVLELIIDAARADG